MNSYSDFARKILSGTTLEDKYCDIQFDWDEWKDFSLPPQPGRSGSIIFAEKKGKFPKAKNLNENQNKAMAIHSFANHELLAIEMMAAALLVYPHKTDEDIRFKKGIVVALKDEQKHLALYVQRLNELGFEFGDFSLNDFFWRQMEKLPTAAHYTAVMALTFEAANLDFAQYYADVFRNFGDDRTAGILDQVLEDEISHVSFGTHWMKKWRQDKTLWDYYRECLPWPMTPARGRGLGFDPDLHLKAVQDEEFIRLLDAYDDDYLITKRPRQK
jgi:uncharacterized ferritin-like protein (DUF455 family)